MPPFPQRVNSIATSVIAAIAIAASVTVASSGLALNISEFRVADAKLKVLAQRVVESQEEERARLSRDLHDGISQWLVSIKLQIEAGIERLSGQPAQTEKALTVFEHTAGQLNKVLGEVRRISHNLRPAVLEAVAELEPIKEPEFYTALMSIWLGPPASVEAV